MNLLHDLFNRQEKAKDLKNVVIGLIGSGVFFNLAFYYPNLAAFVWPGLICLTYLIDLSSFRLSFYSGFQAGLFIFVPQLIFFVNIFGIYGSALWIVPCCWLGILVSICYGIKKYFGLKNAFLIMPIIWTGIEWFRSEMYYLRYSWVNIGFLFFKSKNLDLLLFTGSTGLSFILMLIACLTRTLSKKHATVFGLTFFAILIFITNYEISSKTGPWQKFNNALKVGGLHTDSLELPEIISKLDTMIHDDPNIDLVILGEYSFFSEPPQALINWCKKHQKFVICGGIENIDQTNFFNTAFVINKTGQIEFKQAKAVPIQFFNDGLPAKSQELWHSPWGKLGLAVCYDLSFRTIMDNLVKAGAQGLIVIANENLEWGKIEYFVHSRIAPVRAAEFKLPLVRIGINGISQIISPSGRILNQTEFPAIGKTIIGTIYLAEHGRVPFDNIPGPICSWLSCLVAVFLILKNLWLNSKFKIPGLH